MEAIAFYEMNRTIKRDDLEWQIRGKTPPWRKKYEYGDIGKYLRPIPKLNICEVSTEPLFLKFKRLLANWREQAAPLSSITAMAMLPSYQEIIGMGKPVLPFIMNELKRRPSHLFWALRAISGVDPVPPKDRGHIDRMAEAWIKWAHQNNIIE